MRGARVFTGFAHATSGLGVLMFLVCAGAWGATAAGVADIPPTSEMWQSAGGLVIAGLVLSWLLGATTKTGQEKH